LIKHKNVYKHKWQLTFATEEIFKNPHKNYTSTLLYSTLIIYKLKKFPNKKQGLYNKALKN